MGRVAKKVILTHLMSNAPTARTTGTATTGSTLALQDDAKNFTSLGVVSGDVVRITSGAGKSQASIVDNVSSAGAGTNNVLNFQAAHALSTAVAVGVTYRVEAARQYTDVSNDVIAIELQDYLKDKTQSIIVELANVGNKYASSFAAKDPIEVWIDDGDDTATPAVTFSDDGQRCFVGRIDAEGPHVSADGRRLTLRCRDYTADLLESIETVVFQGYKMVQHASGRDVFTKLAARFNERRGLLADTAAGQPKFDATSSGTATTNPTGDIAFVGQSCFDALTIVAANCMDANNEQFLMHVDSLAYRPRTAGTRPVLYVRSAADAQATATLTWSIVEGVNVLDADSERDGTRTRNRITLFSQRSDDVPILKMKEQVGSGADVLGQDRYGVMENYSTQGGFYDDPAADAAVTSALAQTKKLKHRRAITRRGVIQPGKRLSGLLVNVTLPTGGLTSATSLGIVGARTSLDARGIMTSFDLTNPRSGWDRILAPIQKSTQQTIKEDVWSVTYVYYTVATGNDVNVYRVAPTEYGTAGAATLLFTVANPGPIPADWAFVDLNFHSGRLWTLWQQTAGTGFIVRGVDAYTGASVGDSLQRAHPFGNGSLGGFDVTRQDTLDLWHFWLSGLDGNLPKFQEYRFTEGGLPATVGSTYSADAFWNGAVTTPGFFVRIDDKGHQILTLGWQDATFRAFIQGDASVSPLTFEQIGPAASDFSFDPITGLTWNRSDFAVFLGGEQLVAIKLWSGPDQDFHTVGTAAVSTPKGVELVPFARFYY